MELFSHQLYYSYAAYAKENSNVNWNSLVETQRDSILRKSQQNDAAKLSRLENAINYFTSGKGKIVNGQVPLTENEIQIIKEYLIETFEDQVTLAEKAFETWGKEGVTLKNQEKEVSQDAIKQMKNSRKGQGILMNTGQGFKDKLTAFQKEAETTVEAFFQNPTTKRGKKVEAMWDRVKVEIAALSQEVEASAGKKIYSNIGYNKTTKKSWLQDIQEFAKLIYLQDAINLFSGKFYEAGVAAIAATLAYKENKDSNDLLQYLRDEVQKTNTGMVINNFTIKAELLGVSNKEEFEQFYGSNFGIWNEGTCTVTLAGGQGKVDVTLDIGNLSLKNLTPYKGYIQPHLVSSTPLVKAVLDEPNFGYHYLNRAIQNIDQTEDDRKDTREDANEALRKMLLLYGIAGFQNAQGKNKGADYFMVNNKSTGLTKIYSIKSILERSLHESNYSNKIKVYVNERIFNPTDAIVTQTWSDNYQARLALVMNQLKASTTSVSFILD